VNTKTDQGMTKVRVTNCTFRDSVQAVWWNGWCYGVTDHCTFLNCWIGVILYGGVNDLGDSAWARKDYQAGSANFPFTEDCTFTWDLSSEPGCPWVTYHQTGGRSVLRHCVIDSRTRNGITGPVDCHGNQSYWSPTANNFRGTIRFEFYENTIRTGSSWQMMDLRGGSSLVHDNTFEIDGGNICDYREEESDPHNTPGVPLRSPVQWPAEDQICATFVWNNTVNGQPANPVGVGGFGNSSAQGDPFYIKEGRDYWLKAPDSTTKTTYPPPGSQSRPDYPSPYDSLQLTAYTPYQYPHHLVSGAPVEPPIEQPPAELPEAGDGTTIPVAVGQTQFRVLSAGQYSLVASVIAPDEGENSIWIDFDADPLGDDTRCWDMEVVDAWDEQAVNWRGPQGRALAPQFAPKVWDLSAGTHTLYIVEREPAQIRSVTFALANSAEVEYVVQVIAPPQVPVQVLQSPTDPVNPTVKVSASGPVRIEVVQVRVEVVQRIR